MTEELNPLPDVAEDEDDLVSFTFKRTHLYLALIPLAFMLGLYLGYYQWGQASGAVPVAVAPQAAAGQQGGAAPAVQVPQEVVRYDISIRDTDPSIGPEDAPITIIEFSDFECPYCRRHALEVYDKILDAYEGQVRYIYKNFPLESIHANAFPAAAAAQCAHEQGEFWGFHDRLFSMELSLGMDAYVQYATELDLDVEAFSECVFEERYLSLVQEDYDFAVNLGVRSTPTFFINGIPFVGAQPFESFVQLIDSELALEN